MWCHSDANAHLVRIKCCAGNIHELFRFKRKWDLSQFHPTSLAGRWLKNVKSLVSLKFPGERAPWRTRGSIKHGHRVSEGADSPVGRSCEPLPLGGNWSGTARKWAGRGCLRQSVTQEMTVSETSITPSDDGYRKECNLPPLKVVLITNKWEEWMHLCFFLF